MLAGTVVSLLTANKNRFHLYMQIRIFFKKKHGLTAIAKKRTNDDCSAEKPLRSALFCPLSERIVQRKGASLFLSRRPPLYPVLMAPLESKARFQSTTTRNGKATTRKRKGRGGGKDGRTKPATGPKGEKQKWSNPI